MRRRAWRRKTLAQLCCGTCWPARRGHTSMFMPPSSPSPPRLARRSGRRPRRQRRRQASRCAPQTQMLAVKFKILDSQSQILDSGPVFSGAANLPVHTTVMPLYRLAAVGNQGGGRKGRHCIALHAAMSLLPCLSRPSTSILQGTLQQSLFAEHVPTSGTLSIPNPHYIRQSGVREVWA